MFWATVALSSCCKLFWSAKYTCTVRLVSWKLSFAKAVKLMIADWPGTTWEGYVSWTLR